MRIGIDFDNTLIDYDPLVRRVAIERGLISVHDGCRTKQQIRDAIRVLPDGDLEWQRIQSWLYTAGIAQAQPPPGLSNFFEFARRNRIETWIISHKTETATFDPTGRSLRVAALEWMQAMGFFSAEGMALPRDHVVFAATKDEKLTLIRQYAVTVFIDDLPEILDHPAFPASATRILYGSGEARSTTGLRSLGWDEITRLLAEALSRERIGAALHAHGVEPLAIAAVRGGRNSRCYRVTPADGGEDLFLKQYFRSDSDPRDRLGTEYRAVSFMRGHGLDCVPRPRLLDRENGYAAYGFVAGAPAIEAETEPKDIDTLLRFIAQLHDLRVARNAATLPVASEACFSAVAFARNLRTRFARLDGVEDPDLQEFLGTVRPVIEPTLEASFALLRQTRLSPESELPAELRTLSPSDIGFHNAIRTGDAGLTFTDFEYFGWDDPAKLVCDFLLQPEQRLSAELRERFRSNALDVYEDAHLSVRIDAYLPLLRLKWIAILLNEFLCDDGARRAFAQGDTGDRRRNLHTQLEKARSMAAPLAPEPVAPNS